MHAKPLHRTSKPVAIWLLIGVGMIIIQILLGGITRLTGSGLSITEWNIITGTLPPMNEQQWIVEFEKYKQTPQFQLLNFDFTLKDFKFIFFWEWLHRFWARLIGLVFAIPFIIFLLQKRFRPSMVKPMIILFLLGALQGAVGWIMVASGLTGDAIYVKPARLAIHFVLAMLLLAYTFWFALQLLVPQTEIKKNSSLQKLSISIIVILVVQFVYGALMAGYKAATAAPTWPDINGSYFPDTMFSMPAIFQDLFENKITIHFVHRTLAYVILVMIFIWTWKAIRSEASDYFRKTKWLPAMLVMIQVVLGVYAVIKSPGIIPGVWGVFEWMAQLHQLVAMLLLLALLWMLFITRKTSEITT